MGKQIQLLLLDAVLHLTAGTADLLMEGLSGVVVGRQRSDHEAGIGTAGQDSSALANTRRWRDQLSRVEQRKSMKCRTGCRC